MSIKRLFPFFCFLLPLCPLWALTYEKSDSLRVVELLSEGAKQPEGTNLMLFYAHRLEGTPYVAQTLECNAEEQLVVNLAGLDCTTFVETVAALTLTTWRGSIRWDDYCRMLATLRYREGEPKGYASRNHYFSQWVQHGEGLELVHEIQGNGDSPNNPFSGQKPIDLHFMTHHPDLYPMMKGDTLCQQQVGEAEREASGDSVRYIPLSRLLDEETLRAFIHNGDILALVTVVEGLDVSHLGLAEWGSDGHLYLFDASSRYKRVLREQEPLGKSLQNSTRLLGIRVVRVGK